MLTNEFIIKYQRKATAINEDWKKIFFNSSFPYFCSPEWHQVVLSLYEKTYLTKKINKLYYFNVANTYEENSIEFQLVGFFYVTKTIRGNVINFGHLLGPSDYYDFIYMPSVTPTQIANTIKQIQSDFNAKEIRFSHVKSTSKIVEATKLLRSFQKKALNCVAIALPFSYEEYFQRLSKNVRQNIRTAYNRLHKESFELELTVQTKAHADQIDFQNLKKMYFDRNKFRKENLNWKSKIYYGLDYLFHSQKDIFDINAIKEADFTLALLKCNGEIAAYFFGFKKNKTLEINRVVINEEFKFYSPGLLLFNEFMKKYSGSDLTCIDLTVGDEKYKYDLGGVTHKIYNIKGTL